MQKLLISASFLALLAGCSPGSPWDSIVAFFSSDKPAQVAHAQDAATAQRLFAEGEYRQAMQLGEQLIEGGQKSVDLRWLTAAAALRANAAEKAAKHMEKLLVEEGPTFELLKRLVQVYEKLGQTALRDRARDMLVSGWRASSDPEIRNERAFVRDIFRIGGRKIYVKEYFELKGAFAARYTFEEKPRVDAEPQLVFSLGSYPSVVEHERRSGYIDSGTRVYHFDAYDGLWHYAFGVLDAEPSYEAVKGEVLRMLADDGYSSRALATNAFPALPTY